ncbi:MAG: hypothetical protein K0R64_3582 [Novosphingobium lindaniclasticum]|jgi:hypothetical protein|uniref:hypothetical protein n=1 Tax=Novosphingobium lindaniclasticum TaxID=1329895 RepID=UPI002409714F|nr:hypothetical protein [Novosphingobium lindaniclasticum]MDF2640598.1 hypothetical protein [Novosphingobium lindaniclasticum]
MITVPPALAGLALLAAAPADAAESASAPASSQAATESVTVKEAAGGGAQAERSDEASRVVRWVASSHDNRSLPYVVIDKKAARAYLFNGQGKALGDAPVLIGVQPGDDATPGIGAKSLSEIGPAERTTPAGRFLAKFGKAAGNQKVLWVDYATSVALHTIPVGNKEKRRERMLSKTIADNRITFGCINVPKVFYNKGVVPLFQKKGGYVYILPDIKSIEEVFPRLRVQPFLDAAAP